MPAARRSTRSWQPPTVPTPRLLWTHLKQYSMLRFVAGPLLVLAGPGTIEDRAAAERSRMIADLHAESADYGLRLRVVIAAFTGAAALFGAMVLSIVKRK